MQLIKTYICRIIRFLFNKYSDDSKEGAWISLQRDHSNGNLWIWDNEDPLEANSTLWSPNEPNNAAGNENCAIMYRSNGLINDAPCERNYEALCEIPLQ